MSNSLLAKATKAVISEYHVNALIDDWDEISVTHKDINEDFFNSLLTEIKVFDFIENAYIANNSLIRFDIKNVTPKEGFKYFSDIAIHPRSKSFIMIRNDRSKVFKEYEDQIIQFIVNKLEGKK